MARELAHSRRSDGVALAGAVGCLAALLAAALLPPSAWRAWLAAVFLCSAVPIGAMALLMIARLTPGGWSRELGPFLEGGALLLPLAALLFLPVLFETHALYGWTREAPETPFRAAWLSMPFFVVRTVVWFAALGALLYLMVVRGAAAPAIACIGLVLFPTLGTFIAVDWLLSLDAHFASSGFGLYVLDIQMLTAYSAGLVALLLSRKSIESPGLLAGMLLTFLLLWDYFAFLHYFISWSTNLPPGVLWYHRRSQGGWGAAMWFIASTRVAPSLLLLFATIRTSPRALLVIAVLVICGSALEAAWLAFPVPAGEPATTRLDLVLFAAIVVAMGALMTGGLPRVLAWRERRRAS